MWIMDNKDMDYRLKNIKGSYIQEWPKKIKKQESFKQI